MNYSDLITMAVLIIVPAIAAWWWIQKANGRPPLGGSQGRPNEAGEAKRPDPK